MANYFSQHDPKYKKVKLGNSQDTIYNSGCFLVSQANLFQVDPEWLNNYYKKTGVFSGALIKADVAASRMGYTYKKVSNNPKVRCIAETDHFKSKGIPQHFFLLKPDKSIIDPLDYPSKFKQNPYHIVSYRVFTKIDLPVQKPETPTHINETEENVDIEEPNINEIEPKLTPEEEKAQLDINNYNIPPEPTNTMNEEKNEIMPEKDIIDKLIELIIIKNLWKLLKSFLGTKE